MSTPADALRALNDVLPDGEEYDDTYAVVLPGPSGTRTLTVLALGEDLCRNGEHADALGAVTDHFIDWNRRLERNGYRIPANWIPSSSGTWTGRLS